MSRDRRINREITSSDETTYGYSRDHRPDLKQFIMELICSGDGDIPIFLKSASGNQADSSCFGEIAVSDQKKIEVDSNMVPTVHYIQNQISN